MSGRMANTIQWNAVRKEMVQKINRISHRRLNTKNGSLCYVIYERHLVVVMVMVSG